MNEAGYTLIMLGCLLSPAVVFAILALAALIAWLRAAPMSPASPPRSSRSTSGSPSTSVNLDSFVEPVASSEP
ncbi:MAG: hypothetical protein R2844_01205 [Caldilineales bacterium]